jgi:mitogen-activated protein kinase 4/6
MYEFRDVGTVLKSDGKESPLLYQVYEYAEIGTLFHLISNLGVMNDRMARFYMKKLLDAVEVLQGLNIAHRDIKPLNIFISNDENVLKLGDFGLALEYETDYKIPFYEGIVGTVTYRPLDYK